MFKINYYIPPKDKNVRKEQAVGNGKITITQGEQSDSFRLNDFNDKTIGINDYGDDIEAINNAVNALRYSYGASISPSSGLKFYNDTSFTKQVVTTAYKLDNVNNVYVDFNAYTGLAPMQKQSDGTYKYTDTVKDSRTYNIYSDDEIIKTLSFTLSKVGYIYIGTVGSDDVDNLRFDTQEWIRNNQDKYTVNGSPDTGTSKSCNINTFNGNYYIFVAVARNNSGLADIKKPESSTINSTKYDALAASDLTFRFESVINDKNYSFYFSPELSDGTVKEIPIYIKF